MGTFLAMTFKTAMKLPMLALASALMLAGCSNDPNQGAVLKSLKAEFSKIGKKSTPATVSKSDVSRVLSQTSGPVSQIVQSNLGDITVILVHIETNGPYKTYASASKQTVTFRQGLVTATRGLGNDMMSAQAAGTLSLISGRRSGTSKRTLRYLDGANDVIAFEFDCQMKVVGSGRVNQGVVSANTTKMTEHCVAPTREFTNTYEVDSRGMILSSKQWVSPIQGYFDISVLRR